MTLVTGTVQDLGYDGMEGTLWARPARFRSDGQVVYAPERKPYKVVDGVVSADLAPGPAVLELQVGSHARGTFEVVIPEADISLADLLDTVFPWEPEQVSLFVAEREAAQQAAADAETAAGTATTAAQQTGQDRQAVAQDRSHVDQVRIELDEAFDESTAGNVLPPRLTEAALNATYADLPTVQAVDDRTKPQKMLFELPVPKPHRAPTLAVQRMIPDSDARLQVVFTEGETLWATGADRSLYRSTATGQWERRAYLPHGVALRGGMTRAKDGGLLWFGQDYSIRRSANDGTTSAVVLERRAPGLEPLTSQSVAMHDVTGHLFYGEYTNGVDGAWPDVVLWRSTDHGVTWHVFYTWPYGITLPGGIKHVHSVQYDPIGQDIYVMLGDGTADTGIWKVSGETCVPVLTNGMLTADYVDSPRAIGMMFFPDWIAWGSDSTANPYLFRIPRAAFGTDPAALERGPRLSSTAWGTARASEDGTRWVMFASDEAFPVAAADRLAHIYAVEDQGATMYEVATVAAQTTSGVSTLQPLAPPHKYGVDFWFAMRTGSHTNVGAWKARLGYGAPSVPWPTAPTTPLIQSASSGYLSVPPATLRIFGVTRVPVYATKLAIYESGVAQQTEGNLGNLIVEAVVDGAVVYSNLNASARASARGEFGGPVTVVQLAANQTVQFRLRNIHSGVEIAGTGSLSFAWVQ